MSHPDFFDSVPRLALFDPLAALLGASSDGRLEYGYLDAVRLAGHSCPTVASAYWLTCRALGLLYGEQLPERGAIRVSFRGRREEGVTGVMGAVVSLLTGAAGEEGFKGLGGLGVRRGLLSFGADIPLALRFERLDGGGRVEAEAHPQQVPADPAMGELLQAVLADAAGPAERQRFARLWQERVGLLLGAYREDPRVFVLQRG